MKALLPIIIILACTVPASAQNYDRRPVCGTDTVLLDYEERYRPRGTDTVDAYSDMKRGQRVKLRRISYKAFRCTQVTKLGVRFDLGFNTYVYDPKTASLKGNHNGAMIGFAVNYGNFTIGAKFKPSTTYPPPGTIYRGEAFPKYAILNPIKIDYDLSYSLHLRYNFCAEPYLALTSHSFRVIDTIGGSKQLSVAKTKGLTAGLTLNKYFRLKDFEYLAIFARYGYGLTNFRKIDNTLGFGYHDISFGVAYKVFGKRRF